MTAHPGPAAEIRLPCGVVLKHYREPVADFVSVDAWSGEIGCVHPIVMPDTQRRGGFVALLGDADFGGTREECVAWLNEECLALRRALAPSDAEERATAALTDIRMSILANTVARPKTEGELSRLYARAVLSALGLAKEEPHE